MAALFAPPLGLSPIPMKRAYRGEELGIAVGSPGEAIPYFDADKRAECRLLVHEGRLYQGSGSLLTRSGDEQCRGIVTIDRNFIPFFGFVSGHRGWVRHSSFVGGESTWFAGEAGAILGCMTMLTNLSGHYCPSWQHLYLALKVFEHYGTDVSKTDVTVEDFRTSPGMPVPRDCLVFPARMFMSAVEMAGGNGPLLELVKALPDGKQRTMLGLKYLSMGYLSTAALDAVAWCFANSLVEAVQAFDQYLLFPGNRNAIKPEAVLNHLLRKRDSRITEGIQSYLAYVAQREERPYRVLKAWYALFD